MIDKRLAQIRKSPIKAIGLCALLCLSFQASADSDFATKAGAAQGAQDVHRKEGGYFNFFDGKTAADYGGTASALFWDANLIYMGHRSVQQGRRNAQRFPLALQEKANLSKNQADSFMKRSPALKASVARTSDHYREAYKHYLEHGESSKRLVRSGKLFRAGAIGMAGCTAATAITRQSETIAGINTRDFSNSCLTASGTLWSANLVSLGYNNLKEGINQRALFALETGLDEDQVNELLKRMKDPKELKKLQTENPKLALKYLDYGADSAPKVRNGRLFLAGAIGMGVAGVLKFMANHGEPNGAQAINTRTDSGKTSDGNDIFSNGLSRQDMPRTATKYAPAGG